MLHKKRIKLVLYLNNKFYIKHIVFYLLSEKKLFSEQTLLFGKDLHIVCMESFKALFIVIVHKSKTLFKSANI